MTLTADGDVSIRGQNVRIKSNLAMQIQAGTQATVSASMGATVDGGLAATLRGASVSVNGLTSFSPG
jgi:hypothetical protein